MKTKELREIGERLQLARTQAGISQKSAGLHMGRTRQAVSSWEAGETEIGAEQIGRLAALYCVTTDYLITGQLAVPVVIFPTPGAVGRSWAATSAVIEKASGES